MLRRVASATRQLHPARDCFHAIGYAIELLLMRRIAGTGFRFVLPGETGGVTLHVRERVTDATGGSFPTCRAGIGQPCRAHRHGPRLCRDDGLLRAEIFGPSAASPSRPFARWEGRHAETVVHHQHRLRHGDGGQKPRRSRPCSQNMTCSLSGAPRFLTMRCPMPRRLDDEQVPIRWCCSPATARSTPPPASSPTGTARSSILPGGTMNLLAKALHGNADPGRRSCTPRDGTRQARSRCPMSRPGRTVPLSGLILGPRGDLGTARENWCASRRLRGLGRRDPYRAAAHLLARDPAGGRAGPAPPCPGSVRRARGRSSRCRRGRCARLAVDRRAGLGMARPETGSRRAQVTQVQAKRLRHRRAQAGARLCSTASR